MLICAHDITEWLAIADSRFFCWSGCFSRRVSLLER